MTDRSVTVRLRGVSSGLVASFAAAKKAAGDFNDELAKSAQKRDALNQIGTAMGAVGLAAGAGVAIAVKKFADFDSAMSSVAATGDDARGSMNALRKAAIDAGASTAFNATESANAIENLAKAGVSAKDILGGGLKGSLDLAAAGQLDVADAAEIAATALVQFKLKGKDVPHVADLLAAAAGKAQGEVSDMGLALKYVGPVAAQMGVSIEETTGTIALLASNGILADQAGTSLRGMLSSLTSPSKLAAKTMKDLGINVYNSKGEFVGFDGVAGQLKKGLDDLTNAERDQALGRIFGNEQITAARILYDSGAKSVRKWTKDVNDQGYAADTAATKMDNLAGDWEEFTGALETAFITTGEGADGPLRNLVQALTGITNAYNDLPQPAKNATLAIGGITTAVGLGGFAVTRAITGYADFRDAIDTLGWSAKSTGAKFSKAKLLMRGGLIAGGSLLAMQQFGDTTTTSGKAINTLSNAAAGAAIGFGVGGPWGAAIGAGAGAFFSLSGAADSANSSLEESEAYAKNLAGSFDQATGAITRTTRALVLEDLRKNQPNLVAGLNQIGVATRDVVGAVLGQEGAIKRVNKAVRDSGNEWYEYANGGRIQVKGLAMTLPALREEFEKTANEQRRNIRDTKTWREALDGVPKKVFTELKAKGFQATFKDVSDLKEKYDLTPRQVETIFRALGIKNAHADIKSLSKEERQLARKHDIKVGTPGAKDSIGIFQSLFGWIDKVPNKKSTKTDAPGIEKTTKQSQGLAKLINDVMPNKKDIDTDAPGVDPTTRKMLGLDKTIRAINGKTVDVKLSTNAAKIIKQVGNAIGDVGANAFADGGFAENHVAQIARPGAMRVWAEPETGGEAYIPLAQSKRARSLNIWQETGRRLGVEGFADGGVRVPTYSKGDNLRKNVGQIDTMFGEIASEIGKRASKMLSKAVESMNTGFHWPLPRKYGYSGSWGSYSSGGSHPALDFPAPTGTPIYSVLPGRVMHTTSLGDRSYGNYTEVKHGGALSSLYAHQSAFKTKKGAVVGAGETIGAVGSVGNSTGPHLHLEVKRNGTSFDFTSMLKSGTSVSLPGDYDLTGSGVERFVPVVKDVLRALNGRESALPSIMARMQKESGGDVDIVNTSDSNWVAGHPSVGLMQVIGPTYQANKPTPDRGPYKYGTSIDPFSNIYAGLNYARGRYGTIENGMTQPGGYADGAIVDFFRQGGFSGTHDSGGWVPHGGLAFNASGGPEAFLNTEDSKNLRRILDGIQAVIKGGNSGGGRKRNRGGDGIDTPDLTIVAEQAIHNAEQTLVESENRLTRAQKRAKAADRAVDKAEDAVADAKGKKEKQEAKAALEAAKDRQKLADKQLTRAEKAEARAEKELAAAKEERAEAKANQKILDRAVRQFDIKPGQTGAEMRQEFRDLLAGVREAMGKDSKLYQSLQQFRDRLIDSTKRLDEERAERAKVADRLKALRQASRDYASTVAGNFKNDPFGGGLDEFYLQTNADKNDARRSSRLRRRAERLGLDGPLMKAILASGNVDLLAELVRGGRSEIRKAERAYEARNKAANVFGDSAALQVYGKKIDRQTRALERETVQIERLRKRLEHMEDRIGDRVEKGARRGIRDRDKDKNHLVAQIARESQG